MNKLLLALFIVCCVGSASAQSTTASTDNKVSSKATVNTPDPNAPAVNSFCPQSGSMLNRKVNTTSARAVDCASFSPGRTYSNQDINRTGAQTTAEALRRLDPAIH
jgi:hypothetical protein